MRLKLASALLALSAITVSACGFTPVYSSLDDTSESSIQVEEIPGAAGHTLRQELIQLLRPGIPGIQSARLEVILDESSTAFSIDNQGGNVRTSAKAEAKYTLFTDKGVIIGETEGSASFFTAERPISDIMARREAAQRAVKDVARQIVSDLTFKAGREDSYRDASKFKDQ